MPVILQYYNRRPKPATHFFQLEIRMMPTVAIKKPQ